MKNKIKIRKNHIDIIIYGRKNNRVVVVKIDKDDKERAIIHNWYLSTRSNGTDGYIRSGTNHAGLHQLIMGRKRGYEIDHINRNILDNRKSNLRFVTHSKNMRNAKIQSNNKSGIKGVHWCKEIKKWQALIGINNKQINLGYFINKGDATNARICAEKKYWHTH